jgi:hypothetical protein
MWFLTASAGTPSATHLSMMTFDEMPSSFAISWMRFANRRSENPPEALTF